MSSPLGEYNHMEDAVNETTRWTSVDVGNGWSYVWYSEHVMTVFAVVSCLLFGYQASAGTRYRNRLRETQSQTQGIGRWNEDKMTVLSSLSETSDP